MVFCKGRRLIFSKKNEKSNTLPLKNGESMFYALQEIYPFNRVFGMKVDLSKLSVHLLLVTILFRLTLAID